MAAVKKQCAEGDFATKSMDTSHLFDLDFVMARTPRTYHALQSSLSAKDFYVEKLELLRSGFC